MSETNLPSATVSTTPFHPELLIQYHTQGLPTIIY